MRRRAGEGSVRSYETAQGTRYLIVYRVADPLTGKQKQLLRRGFRTEREATSELRSKLSSVDCGQHVEPSKQLLAEYLDAWLAGMRISAATRSSYEKNLRLHVRPKLGQVRLSQLTGLQLTALYRELEESGRTDGKGGLSPRTVRYVHMIVARALKDAVRDGRLAVNPAERSTPPTAKEAAAPEMKTWTAGELGTFLTHVSGRGNDLAPAWSFMAATAVRRGEALALRWGDVKWSTSRVAIRRAVGVVKTKGEGEEIVEGPTKTAKARVIDIDADTVTMLRALRTQLAGVSLLLAKDDALVFGTLTGTYRHPERFSRRFKEAVTAARRDLGEDALPAIRLHDLRHTHATLLLEAGESVKVVQERLGHASPVITLSIYAHVVPGMQAGAAARYAEVMGTKK